MIGEVTHDMSRTPEYKIWIGMKARCNNEKDTGYKNYGGRGIKVCERWINSFENFYEDMGGRPEGNYSIERKDNNGNYCKENCYWATKKEQANNRRSNRLIEYNGEIHSLSEWESKLNLNRGDLKRRLNRLKWSFEKAITTPFIRKPRKSI